MQNREPISQFLKRTDFFRKLDACLENIREGGAHYPFEGLQIHGGCWIHIRFDGETVNIDNPPEVTPTKHIPKPPEKKASKENATAEDDMYEPDEESEELIIGKEKKKAKK